MLFRKGDFTSAAGLRLGWKIECDALDEDDWACIAYVGSKLLYFGAVIGVPRGGIALASAMQPYATPGAPMTLICDDVWTTGKSMRALAGDVAEAGRWIGYVGFARGPLPANVWAFLQVPHDH